MPSCVLAGATGLTGQHLWPLLAESPTYQRVHLLLRRPLGLDHPKVVEHVIDFAKLDQWEAPDAINHVYSTLGTTQKNAGSKAAFYAVDHDLVVGLGALAHREQAESFAFVSSSGANANSSSFYLKVKGETERDLAALALPRCLAIRPALLMGPREEYRAGEVWGERLLKFVEPLLIGSLRRYRPIHVATVARAMLALSQEDALMGFQVIESETLATYA
jgi:uncharacterized protein YbjT (DUF2867 family)